MSATIDQAAASSDDDRSSVKSLLKALSLLDALGAAARPLTVSELARATGISRPTAHRLIQTLVSAGYVAEDPDTGRLSIGYSVLALSATALDRNRLRTESLPQLQNLAAATGERTNLGILHRGQVLYLAGVEKPNLPMIYSRFGKTAPVHCCSLGKVMRAWLPAEEAEAILRAGPLVAATPYSETDPDRVLAELATIRANGYATDMQEHMVASFCIGAPIRDAKQSVIGAISISCSTPEKARSHIQTLLDAAERISHGM